MFDRPINAFSLDQIQVSDLFMLMASVCPGDGVRGAGCCAKLPVFFSQNSGLVAVVARESASILPETMEDSLCSSLAAAPEVRFKESRLSDETKNFLFMPVCETLIFLMTSASHNY